MKIVFFSMKFSAGHINWLTGYINLFKEAGFEVLSFLDSHYYDYLPSNVCTQISSRKELMNQNPDLLWIVNPSEKHLLFVIWMKLHMKTKVFYYYHEPFPGLEIFKEGIKSLRALAACIISSFICMFSYKVVLPSNNSLEKYKKYSKLFNKNFCMLPLLYVREDRYDDNKKSRKFFSFIGTFAESHGTDGFMKFISYAYKVDSEIKFLIATKSNISTILDDPELKQLISEERLIIQQGRNMTVNEINSFYEQSICVWNIYTRSNQSGVLPNSLMLGTPVLASNTGIFPEIIVNNYNGYLIEDICDLENILNSYKRIKADIQRFSKNALCTFAEKYDYRPWVTKIIDYIK